MKRVTRRLVLSALGTSIGSLAYSMQNSQPRAGAEKLRVLVAGGHPDDPESGCGGTIALLSSRGHAVVSLYLTRGEAGIEGKTQEEAARIRSEEARKACEILGAKPLFAGQIDGSTEINSRWYAAIAEIVRKESPQLILTHWPVDTHRDHRAISLLVYDAWLQMKPQPGLYYFEVLTGSQTQAFRPTDYIDISSVESRKRQAVFAHASQKPEEWYSHHEQMSRFRGVELGCEHAEAFVRHERGPRVMLSGKKEA